MKIEIIGAKNFLTLEDFQIDISSNYCAISGQNNAGKTAMTRVLRHFFDNKDEDGYWGANHSRISFARDFTQWVNSGDIQVFVQVNLNKNADSEVFFVVQTYSPQKELLGDNISVKLKEQISSEDKPIFNCTVDGKEVEGQGAIEILKKLRSTANLFVYNSTEPARHMYYRGDSFTEVVEAHFSLDDRRKISDAERSLQTKVKKAARQHKDDLDRLLGKLADKYHVELTTIDSGRSSRFPLAGC
jgi:putative ATP-dependent endonuclease of the OLD family